MALKDPELSAGVIVGTHNDQAWRNDGVELQIANKKPWYVLATIFGEQEDAKPWSYNASLAAKNRRAWNGWFCGDLDEREREKRAEDVNLNIEELGPLSNNEVTEIKKRFFARVDKGVSLPSEPKVHRDQVDMNFGKLYFTKPFIADKFIFERDTSFSNSVFKGDVHSIRRFSKNTPNLFQWYSHRTLIFGRLVGARVLIFGWLSLMPMPTLEVLFFWAPRISIT